MPGKKLIMVWNEQSYDRIGLHCLIDIICTGGSCVQRKLYYFELADQRRNESIEKIEAATKHSAKSGSIQRMLASQGHADAEIASLAVIDSMTYLV